MIKCKNCGTEFESKFCPNCGAPASEQAEIAAVSAQAKNGDGLSSSTAVAENASVEWTASPLEKQIREKGVHYAIRKNTTNYFPIRVALTVLLIASIAACVALAIVFGKKVYNLYNAEGLELLLIYIDTIDEIKDLAIWLSVVFAANCIIIFVNDYHRDISICKWLKRQDINAPKIILAGLVNTDGIVFESDKNDFLETKRYLYDAKCAGVQAEKKYLRSGLIELIVSAVCNIICIVLLMKACEAFDVGDDGKLVLPITQLIAFVVIWAVQTVITRFVKKGVKTRESDIDFWARKQEDEQKKAALSA